jgi:hypothetical protein
MPILNYNEIKLLPCLIKYHTIKMHGAMEAEFHTFLTLVLDGGKWSASHSGPFISRETAPGTQQTATWGGLHSQSEHGGKEKNLCSCWELNPGCPVHCLVTILTKLPHLLDMKKLRSKLQLYFRDLKMVLSFTKLEATQLLSIIHSVKMGLLSNLYLM